MGEKIEIMVWSPYIDYIPNKAVAHIPACDQVLGPDLTWPLATGTGQYTTEYITIILIWSGCEL